MNDASLNRRNFLKGSSAVFAAGLAQGNPWFAHHRHDDTIRIGLIGCGGRGTGAVTNALNVEPNAKLVALCDAFPDRLQSSLENLRAGEHASRIAVDGDHQFTGFDGYKDLIASVDVVLLAATPHFRPRHLEAAVAAGKHVFCEKPVAVDAPGIHRVMEACRQAKEKGLSIVSGLCYRYDEPKIETQKRIHDGAVGDVVALQCTYNASGLWHRGSQADWAKWSDMEYQIRNWLYFTWLSGDHIAEQSIHSLDKILWARGDVAPAKVTASGGRIARTDPKYGNVFDHFNTVFEWDDGVKLFHSCRQWEGADTDVSDYVFGTKGTAAIQHHRISGENEWRFRGRPQFGMYDAEMAALFKSIHENAPINNGDYMCKSTLMAIMGRMSAYTGKSITWQQALDSKLDYTPAAYAWGQNEVEGVACPGRTQFV
ncbi:MAG: Gfo/Idh/MocA family oxidoreductase [Planctomycetes bacterium]|nr:Gfo/Idh/MocA family oxidoreductase [Planctomycetota bacterium]